MSAYIERNIDVIFKNEESSMLLNFTELGQTFYYYFIESTNSNNKKLRMGSPVQDLYSDLSHQLPSFKGDVYMGYYKELVTVKFDTGQDWFMVPSVKTLQVCNQSRQENTF